ncbi:unnamed protein product [Schistosoma mattheei]|uniref:Uncharacterized protein n=1 Tax=Schistosoma mattheei TaxID=31246 RepID=A0A183PZ50_9TREM|nr:unnamed protein product [Schistosoma mattheei]
MERRYTLETRIKRSKKNTEIKGEILKAVCDMYAVNDELSVTGVGSDRLSSSKFKLGIALLRKKK